MCGIAGVVGADDPRAVREMCRLLRHRGPDSTGFFDAAGVHLGMTRLAIMDVAGGDQPVFDETGRIAVVFNGEIYNSEELRRSLAPAHHLASRADTECLPHLYEEFGSEFPTQLNGMFAVAVWDSGRRRLQLTVDRLGKKPIYYAVRGGALFFASELWPLLKGADLPRNVDPGALGLYLTYRYVPPPHSAINGVGRVPPGHALSFEGGAVTVRRYWAPPESASESIEADVEDEFRRRLLDATRSRMDSERPVGAFLSGGLDSAAVVAAMSRVSDRPVKTFSVGFAGEPDSELPVARRISAHLQTEHNEIIVQPDVETILPELVRHVGEPFADPSLIPTFAVSQAARSHVVVALTGDGGDEAFGGYPHYLSGGPVGTMSLGGSLLQRQARRLGLMASWGGPARPTLLRAASSSLLTLAEPDPAIRYARFMAVFRPEDWPALIRPEFQSVTREGTDFEFLAGVFRGTRGDLATRMMLTDARTFLPGDLLVKVDIASMACSLEVRSPFLDFRLFEWAASLPASVKLAEGRSKAVMRRALGPWLPPDVLGMPKRGFGVPLARWLNGPLRPMVGDLILTPQARIKEFLVPATVDSIARDRRQRSSVRLWTLLMLELFLREVAQA